MAAVAAAFGICAPSARIPARWRAMASAMWRLISASVRPVVTHAGRFGT